MKIPIEAARRIFAHLMKRAREHSLTDKERAQLRTASQIIRYEKRRAFTGAVNRPRGKHKSFFRSFVTGKGLLYPKPLYAMPFTKKKASKLLYDKGFNDSLLGKTPEYPTSRPYMVGYRKATSFASGKWGPYGFGPSLQRQNPSRKRATWTLQRYTEIAGQPWYALQQRIGGKLIRQYNGYKHEMDALARRLNVRPRLLRPTTEEQFFKRNPRGLSRGKARLILHEGVTKQQRKFFGARASGYPRRRARSNPGRRGGLLRMGKLVELRYYRDHGKKPGYYKHRFNGSPTVYYDAKRNAIIAR